MQGRDCVCKNRKCGCLQHSC